MKGITRSVYLRYTRGALCVHIKSTIEESPVSEIVTKAKAKWAKADKNKRILYVVGAVVVLAVVGNVLTAIIN